MTDFTSDTQTNTVEKRRAYVAPAITYASADRGPEGKSAPNPAESTFFSDAGPS